MQTEMPTSPQKKEKTHKLFVEKALLFYIFVFIY